MPQPPRRARADDREVPRSTIMSAEAMRGPKLRSLSWADTEDRGREISLVSQEGVGVTKLGQIPGDLRRRDRPFARGCRDPLDRAAAHVAGGEDARQARFERLRRPSQGPGIRYGGADEVTTGQNE